MRHPFLNLFPGVCCETALVQIPAKSLPHRIRHCHGKISRQFSRPLGNVEQAHDSFRLLPVHLISRIYDRMAGRAKWSNGIDSLSVVKSQHCHKGRYLIRLHEYQNQVRSSGLIPAALRSKYDPGICPVRKRHCVPPFQGQFFGAEEALSFTHMHRHFRRRICAIALRKHFVYIGVFPGKSVSEAASCCATGTVAAVFVHGDRSSIASCYEKRDHTISARRGCIKITLYKCVSKEYAYRFKFEMQHSG